MDDLVPQNHLLRLIDGAIDSSFIYDLVFARILAECYRHQLVDPKEVFVDATHVKARANNKRMQRRIAHEEAKFYEAQLQKEINADREAHEKKPLKDKDGNRNTKKKRVDSRYIIDDF